MLLFAGGRGVAGAFAGEVCVPHPPAAGGGDVVCWSSLCFSNTSALACNLSCSWTRCYLGKRKFGRNTHRIIRDHPDVHAPLLSSAWVAECPE